MHSNAALTVLIAALATSVGCKANLKGTTYSISVINGRVVTQPKTQSPGTYGVRTVFSNGKSEQTAHGTGFFTAPNTFITNGHVVNDIWAGYQIDRREIVDYKGNVVASFTQNDPKVKSVVNPGWVNNQRSDADMGAFIFTTPVDEKKLTHGTVSIASSLPDSGSAGLSMAGNGIQDYRIMTKYGNQGQVPDDVDWGTMRYGSLGDWKVEGNLIKSWGAGLRSDNPIEIGENVASGPADSGAAVFDSQGRVVGLNRGGELYLKKGTDRSKPLASRVDKAYSEAATFTSPPGKYFLDQVTKSGGSFSGNLPSAGTIPAETPSSSTSGAVPHSSSIDSTLDSFGIDARSSNGTLSSGTIPGPVELESASQSPTSSESPR